MNSFERLDAPTALAELQRWMRWALTDPRGLRAALREPAGARRPEPSPRRLQALVDGPALDAAEGLEVYASAYFQRLLESLSADYPLLRSALGEDRFEALVADYLVAHPSSSESLADAGEHLPGFAASHAVSRQVPFAADLARLERARLCALLSDRSPALDASALAPLDEAQWARARAELDATVTLLETEWPVDLLRAASGAASLHHACARRLVVWRGAEGVSVRPLERDEWAALQALQRGRTLGEVCEELAAAGHDEGAVGGWFASWMGAGWVARIHASP